MSPTEPGTAAGKPNAAESAAARIFDEILAPLAAAFRARGRPVLDDVAPLSADSYFSRPRRARMGPEDFDLDLESDERFVDALMALWREEISELDICRDDLIALVEGFRKEARDAEVDPDVSPFVYAMY